MLVALGQTTGLLLQAEGLSIICILYAWPVAWTPLVFCAKQVLKLTLKTRPQHNKVYTLTCFVSTTHKKYFFQHLNCLPETHLTDLGNSKMQWWAPFHWMLLMCCEQCEQGPISILPLYLPNDGRFFQRKEVNIVTISQCTAVLQCQRNYHALMK